MCIRDSCITVWRLNSTHCRLFRLHLNIFVTHSGRTVFCFEILLFFSTQVSSIRHLYMTAIFCGLISHLVVNRKSSLDFSRIWVTLFGLNNLRKLSIERLLHIFFLICAVWYLKILSHGNLKVTNTIWKRHDLEVGVMKRKITKIR